MKPKRIDKLSDGSWVLKDQNYWSVEHAKHIEEKLEMLREIINKFLKERE